MTESSQNWDKAQANPGGTLILIAKIQQESRKVGRRMNQKKKKKLQVQ